MDAGDIALWRPNEKTILRPMETATIKSPPCLQCHTVEGFAIVLKSFIILLHCFPCWSFRASQRRLFLAFVSVF